MLIVLWILTIAAFGLGLLGAPGLAVGAQFFAFVLAIATLVRTEKLGVLRYAWVYRGTLGLLLAATGITLVAAGSTVAFGFDGGKANAGFITLAITNLFASIITWRAFINPAPRRAALVGLVAVIAELVALVVDILISIKMSYDPDTLGSLAILASWAATWAGALVCIAALVSFGPAPMVIVPGARVVDN